MGAQLAQSARAGTLTAAGVHHNNPRVGLAGYLSLSYTPECYWILIPIERIAFPIQQLEPVKDTAKSLLASAERDPKAIVARDQYERQGIVLLTGRGRVTLPL